MVRAVDSWPPSANTPFHLHPTIRHPPPMTALVLPGRNLRTFTLPRPSPSNNLLPACSLAQQQPAPNLLPSQQEPVTHHRPEPAQTCCNLLTGLPGTGYRALTPPQEVRKKPGKKSRP